MKQLLIYIYSRDLREIIICMISLQILWGYVNYKIQMQRTKRVVWNKSMRILFWFCIGVIFYITITKRAEATFGVILTPFHFLIEARTQPELYRSMFMNVFLFFPLGLTLPYALPENWKRKVLTSILFAMIFSIGIEFTQYYFHLGRAETDDVICNTLGCAIGTLSYYLSEKFRKKENDETT